MRELNQGEKRGRERYYHTCNKFKVSTGRLGQQEKENRREITDIDFRGLYRGRSRRRKWGRGGGLLDQGKNGIVTQVIAPECHRENLTSKRQQIKWEPAIIHIASKACKKSVCAHGGGGGDQGEVPTLIRVEIAQVRYSNTSL